MRISFRIAFLFVMALALTVTASLWPDHRVHAMAAPKGVSVYFDDSAATIVWTEVPGSQGYGITIRPIGVHGHFGQEQVLGDRWTVPYTAFPGYGSHKRGYTYEVCSISKRNAQACQSINDSFYVRSQGNGVSTNNLRSAARKVSSCLGKAAIACDIGAL